MCVCVGCQVIFVSSLTLLQWSRSLLAETGSAVRIVFQQFLQRISNNSACTALCENTNNTTNTGGGLHNCLNYWLTGTQTEHRSGDWSLVHLSEEPAAEKHLQETFLRLSSLCSHQTSTEILWWLQLQSAPAAPRIPIISIFCNNTVWTLREFTEICRR